MVVAVFLFMIATANCWMHFSCVICIFADLVKKNTRIVCLKCKFIIKAANCQLWWWSLTSVWPPGLLTACGWWPLTPVWPPGLLTCPSVMINWSMLNWRVTWQRRSTTATETRSHCPTLSQVTFTPPSLCLCTIPRLRFTRLEGRWPMVKSDRTRIFIVLSTCLCHHCLQCLDAVGWAAGRASGL